MVRRTAAELVIATSLMTVLSRAPVIHDDTHLLVVLRYIKAVFERA